MSLKDWTYWLVTELDRFREANGWNNIKHKDNQYRYYRYSRVRY